LLSRGVASLVHIRSAMRPEILHPLFAPTTSLPGVGPKSAVLFNKLAGEHVRDLLFHLPSGVVDRSRRPGVATALDGEVATFDVVVEKHMPSRDPRRPYRVRAREKTGYLTLAWFHARPEYIKRLLPEGARRIVSGKVQRFGSEIQMLHPDHVVTPDDADDIPDYEPVYPLTQGLAPKTLRKVIRAALERAPEPPEWADPHLVARNQWPSWREAVFAAHAPQSAADVEPLSPARARLAYDELFADQLALQLLRARRRASPGRRLAGDGKLVARVRAAAGYAPTGAQLKAFEEIAADMASDKRMGRLLQGDVGSGKTFVAAMAAARAAEAGVQTAIMAPTEILARQHVRTMTPLLAAAGVEVAALTGRDKGAERERLLARLAAGEIGVLCGTHALFQDDVVFKDLGLVVIDEQHRFGVSDRLKLTAKAHRPDLLAMTATPIPRTLTLAAFGDLDVSRLDEKPPGRAPVATRAVPTDRLEELYEAVGRAIGNGDRAYWVCPLVEETDATDLAAAEERWRALATLYGVQRVGLLHGRLSAAEKEARAEAFRTGEIDILVSTTVVEVGVDAPDATIIVIEHAERFGLAQLHQLRGRVGRGTKPSTCVLLYKPPLNDVARARIEALRKSDDGFFIAEEDWRLRGPGEMLGLRQSGLMRYRLAELPVHEDLLEIASQDARRVADEDPGLKSARGAAVRVLLYLFDRDRAVGLLGAG
jgi:ATP-dependent DNA helicase RecG